MSSIHGFAELQRKLLALPNKMRGTVLTDAANAGAKVYTAAARMNAPRGRTGNIRKEIDHEVIQKGANRVVVGVSWRKGRASRTPAFYALFLHQGTKERVRTSGGSTGAITRENPFLTKTFDESSARADRAVAISLRTSLAKAVRSG